MPLPDPPPLPSPDASSDPFTLAPKPESVASREQVPPLNGAKTSGLTGFSFLQAIANGLLVGALLEGGLNFAGCFPAVSQGVLGFELWAGLLSAGVTLLFVLEILAMSSFRELPWRELVPVLAVIFWSRFLYLPLPGLFEWENLAFLGSVLFLAVSLGAAWMIWGHWGTFWIPARAFEAVRFSWRRSLWAMGLKVGVILPLLLGYVALSCVWMVDWKTRGFVKVDGAGVKVEARVYQRGGGRVHLLPTAHIGPGRFYEELMRFPSGGRTAVLPEGVSDRKGLLEGRWSYSGVAKAAGMREQPDLGKKLSGAAVEVCDGDVSDFSPETQKVLILFSKFFHRLNEGDAQKATEVLEEWDVSGRIDREVFRKMGQDLIEKRNAKVMACVERLSPKYEQLVVPWGALHMAGLEAGLLKQGYQRVEAREVRMFEWSDLLKRIWLL